MRPRASTRVRPRSAAGFTLVEILLALLILAVGLLGVLALFPLGIDAARVSAETTRAAIIARAARAHLFEVNGSGSDVSTPFQRILADLARVPPRVGPWYLPYDDEIMDPDFDLNSTTGDGPQTQVVTDDPEAGYSWSITVARPYDDPDDPDDPDGAEPYDYVLGELWRNEHVFIVQVAVYRNYSVEQVDGTLDIDRSRPREEREDWTTMIVEDVPTSIERTFKSGDYVRYLNFDNTEPGDGFWYQIDQIGGDKVKLLERYWGLPQDTGSDRLQFSDRVIGTYTFLLSAD
ncbi:MAG: prepilin-type N-terminal cleavage/methylation domain-containing protein [Planctomycetes bacterium]|nr:prepilin-type N-terminal cleavage/methylation domain-containing protein [Planctomycetota bacterium]